MGGSLDLYDPARHVPINTTAWSESRAEDAIGVVFEAAEDEFDPEHYWPRHPDAAAAPDRAPNLDLYYGAAGTIWGLKQLEHLGYGALANDYEAALLAALTRQLETLKQISGNKPEYQLGLLLGEAGFQVALYKLTCKPEYLERLHELVEANAQSTICEYMWGSPGTLAAALGYFALTREPRWREAYRSGIAVLRSMLIDESTPIGDDVLDFRIWRQSLFGTEQCFLGAVHGFAGNAFTVIKGLKHLDPAQRGEWMTLLRNTALRTARIDGGLANWHDVHGEHHAANRAPLVQHCHGAPGMVTALSGLMDGSDAAFDELMIKAGELVWRAGPLAKGANICHGTAGNGYAFLKLYLQTQDARWLERARAFAMTAIEQMRTRREQT